MTTSPLLLDRFIVVGVDHRTGALDLRDRLFIDDGAAPEFLRRLIEIGIAQAVVLSTCDRVEVVAVALDADASDRIASVLAAQAGIETASLRDRLVVRRGADALRHLFAVAASLESQIVGEPQVLGQVKAAHRIARDAGAVGGELEAVLQAAYGAAKRVRTETAIGAGPVSIAAAARRVANDVHGDLDRCVGLLIGAGDMGELIVGEFMTAGLKDMTVVHPTAGRAAALAARLDCHTAVIDDLARLLPTADIVVTALGTRRHVLTAERVGLALQARKRRPVFLIDAAVPGDVEPAVNRLDGAFLYDLIDLERVATEGRQGRQAEADTAWRIVGDEVTALVRGHAERTAVPSLIALRRHFESARRQALAAAGGDAEEATRLLVNRLLHGPSEEMRAVAAASLAASDSAGEWEQLDMTIRRLFRLDGDLADEGEPE